MGRAGGDTDRNLGGLVVTKSVLAALALAALAPAAAQGGAVIALAQDLGGPMATRPPSIDAMAVVALADIGRLGARPATTSERFSLGRLIDGVDRVLASVGDASREPPNPFGDEAAVFALADTSAHRAGAATRLSAAYDAADAGTESLPEPATWLMMILGFFGLSFAVRRRATSSGDRVRFS